MTLPNGKWLPNPISTPLYGPLRELAGDYRTRMKPENALFDEVLHAAPDEFLKAWLAEAAQSNDGSSATKTALHDAREILSSIQDAMRADADLTRFDEAVWARTRSVLSEVSQSRAAQGASAGETSYFVLAIKKPLFAGLSHLLDTEPQRAFKAIWAASSLVDRMAQWTATTYQRSREDVIQRQQQELLELSTPVVKLWEGVLAVPMIGTLDSSRTQLVMESLLTRIVETGSELAIIDITGVPTVDTLVAQHLLKTVTAIRLMGADCIISGIRPQIAQTIVQLGIDLQSVVTKATLADALWAALKKGGWIVSRPAR
jgi:rsbT co-antagonist protein RsbR